MVKPSRPEINVAPELFLHKYISAREYVGEGERERGIRKIRKKNMIEVTVSAVHFYDLSAPNAMKHEPNGEI